MVRIGTSLTVLFSLIVLCSCVTGKPDQRIRTEDVGWIQKGQTTREQITAKFGPPTFKMPRREDQGVGEYAAYRFEPPTEVLQPRPRGALPQVFHPPTERLQPLGTFQTSGQNFWVLYDDRGVVEEFGFGLPLPAQGEAVE